MKLESFQKDGATLVTQVPAEKQKIESLLADVGDILQRLFSSLATRRQKLEQSLELLQFLSENKNLR